MSGEELSVIIPIKNEAASIRDCVRRVLAALPRAEVLVIDGGDDQAGEFIRSEFSASPGVRYVRHKGDRGKGHAIRTGLRLSTRPVLAQFDADLQFLPEELPRLIAPILEGRADMTLGSRFTLGAERRRGSFSTARLIGNLIISGYCSALFGKRMSDVLAGVKAWRREVSDSFRLTSDRYSYEAELPARALRAGWRVLDVPVTFQARAAGRSSVNVIRTGIELLFAITRFRFGAAQPQ